MQTTSWHEAQEAVASTGQCSPSGKEKNAVMSGHRRHL
jgi:hypothetical protein